MASLLPVLPSGLLSSSHAVLGELAFPRHKFARNSITLPSTAWRAKQAAGRCRASNPVYFSVFSGYSALTSRQKLNGLSPCRRQRRIVVLAATGNGRRQESEEDEEEQQQMEAVEEEEESKEVIDVENQLAAEVRQQQEYREFRESLEIKRNKFWHNLKEQHVVYKVDRDEWGVGLSPIFTVHEDAEGRCYKVDVDENEILLRSGVDPVFHQYVDETNRELADSRIAKAHALAREIVEGVFVPNKLSVLYTYQKAGQETTTVGSGRVGGDKAFVPPNFIFSPIQNLNFATVFALALVGGFTAKWISGRKKKVEDPVVDEQELRLMKMRKMRAKMNKEQVIQNPEVIEEDLTRTGGESTGDKREPPEMGARNDVVDVTPSKEVVVKPRFDEEEFQKKVVEIREMARQARLQEEKTADALSAQNLEKLQKRRFMGEEMKDRSRAQELESLAKSLDDVRRLGFSTEESVPTSDTDFTSGNGLDLGAEDTKPLNGKPPTEQEVGPRKSSTKKSNGDDISATVKPTLTPNASPAPTTQSAGGVKPRIILSPKEARASIAAKRARLDAGDSSLGEGKTRFNLDKMKAKIKSKRAKAIEEAAAGNGSSREATIESSQGIKATSSEVMPESDMNGVPTRGTVNGRVPRLDKRSAPAVPPGEDGGKNFSDKKNSTEETSDQPLASSATDGKTARDGVPRLRPKTSEEEEEEKEWMRDEVLRDIVFKVQANEEAGREPFFNLDSEQEKRFFKGLERKFEREGDRVKTWIKDRVENIDYGADGISVHDPPEAYTMKWKEGKEPPGKKSDFVKKFKEDRKRILRNRSGLDFTSSASVDDEDEDEDEPSKAPAPDSPIIPPPTPPKVESTNIGQGKSKEVITSSGKTTVTSSGRPSSFNPRVSGKEKIEVEPPGGNWQNTKRWAKDLERKYELEKDLETRAVMREMGQDLDRWITEEEIEQANRLLEKGMEGEQEYVRMHYEKTKSKIKEQRELFGREAMMNKYSEYKPEEEEPELWWFDLPFVLCLGLQSTVEGEVQSGLYSVDLSPAMEGASGSAPVFYTVAFQDRGDAHNFSRLLEAESEKLGADGAEVIPFEPKELYRDALAEGFKVTVIKKGQLQLSIDSVFEEVEARIMEIGAARYYDNLLRERTIDMNAVLDEGLGHGQGPQL